MRTSIDQMIDLASAFSSAISLTKDIQGKYLVDVPRVASRDNRHDIMARSIFGCGLSVEEACSDFLCKAKGRILFGSDRNFYGDKPPEYICL